MSLHDQTSGASAARQRQELRLTALAGVLGHRQSGPPTRSATIGRCLAAVAAIVIWSAPGVRPAAAADATSETRATVVVATRAAATPDDTAVTYVAVPLTPSPAVGGVLTKVATAAVTAANDDWSGLDDTDTKPWLLEITTGPAAGWWSAVTEVDPTTQIAALADAVPVSVQPGAQYVLRRIWTIGEVFGGTNLASIDPGATPSDAETLAVVNLATHAQTSYFRSNVPGHTGWHDAAFAPADDAPLLPGRAVILQRRSTDPRALAFTGERRSSALAVVLVPGVSVLGAQAPGPATTLSASGLLAAGFQGGDSAGTADLVIFPQADGSFLNHYYSTAAGNTGWKTEDGADASATTLPADGAFLIRLRSADTVTWRPPLLP